MQAVHAPALHRRLLAVARNPALRDQRHRVEVAVHALGEAHLLRVVELGAGPRHAFVEALVEAPENHNLAVAEQIAKLPAEVRGYGHIKMKAMDAAKQRWDELTPTLIKVRS